MELITTATNIAVPDINDKFYFSVPQSTATSIAIETQAETIKIFNVKSFNAANNNYQNDSNSGGENRLDPKT